MPLGQPLLDALDRMGHGGILLDNSGNALRYNSAAERILIREVGQPKARPDWVRGAINELLTRGTSRFKMDGEAWIVIPRCDGRPLVLHAVPVAAPADSGPNTLLLIVDLSGSPEPSVTALQKVFALTEAEAKLAIQIVRGETPADIAGANSATLATVRSHLASVFAKTQTQRQAELVSLLVRMSILP